MSHLALYRQYRPQTFAQVVGQAHIRTILQNAVRMGKVSHAYLFTGPRGTGKTSLARILSRAMNCTGLRDGEPCNTCSICSAALEESLTDIIEIDAASHTGVDDMRGMIEKAAFAPSMATRKVYIIDEVHMLSKSAFNALLKTLEEPPDHTHFILATTEAHKVLPTIVSRCQRFDFHRVSTEDIAKLLAEISAQEGIDTDEAGLLLIARQARGGLRDALSLLEQLASDGAVTAEKIVSALGLSHVSSVRDFILMLRDRDAASALAHIETLRKEGKDLSHFTHEALIQLRAEMIAAVNAGDDKEIQRLARLIAILFHAYKQLHDPVIVELPLEMAVIEACTSSTAFHELT